MGQQKQSKTKKKELPSNAQRGSQRNHQAYMERECHPLRILRRIARSSGFAAAQEYAAKYGLTSALRHLEVAEPAKQPRLVGRALRRHMKKLSLLAQAKKTAQAQQTTPSAQQ